MKEKKAQANGEEKVKRPPSAYNNFMKTQLAKLKTEDPSLSHSEAFKAAQPMWTLHERVRAAREERVNAARDAMLLICLADKENPIATLTDDVLQCVFKHIRD